MEVKKAAPDINILTGRMVIGNIWKGVIRLSVRLVMP
jgi:hypothetical protein